MSQKGYTKDELYLLKFYSMALEQGDLCAEIDRYAVGRAVGYNDKSVDALTRMLLQANFLKKGEGDALYFTNHGLSLVDDLHALRKN